MSAPIVLYDIPATDPKRKAWSPNTWKVRYSLSFKGLPYKTEWVEYPDIEPLCIKIGAPATSTKADGRPYYTLPVIYDPSTKSVVADSLNIVRYLDKTYPDTPKLLPTGTEAFQAAFLDSAWPSIGFHVFKIIISRTCTGLNEPSQTYFRTTREQTFGKKLEDVGGEEAWKELDAGLGKLDSWLSANGPGKDNLFTGDTITLSDFQVASLLTWAKVVCGEDSEDWKRLAGLQNGKWEGYLAQFEKYAAVDI
ncbi:hypothetical protein PHLCEN_2v11862 [Hermanssonia centrifuga]|uniref:GST N-terminal domain-containing protein n=1 Tax=Hermanssonia centrifuga TaxID=98765 RepID=A0A2R6NIR8_9APHY|nr:hypothetical protein PHLCEN_2v11862 [Hermanssonia centrifuga]